MYFYDLTPRRLPRVEFDETRRKLGCREGPCNGFATSWDWNAIRVVFNAPERFLKKLQQRRNLFQAFVRGVDECSPHSAVWRLPRYVRLMVSSVPSRINTE